MDNAVYRIIDANFNRAREALRIIEEFCRFALNSKSLSARVKELRHQLCNSIAQLDSDRLISSRDTLSDVGVGQVIASQSSRNDLKDCLTAGCKRLVEALRVLSEVIQIHNKAIAKQIEQLRYAAYTLEKDIVLISEPLEKYRKVHLYIIITSNYPAEILSLASQCATSGADCIQLRAKQMQNDDLFAAAIEFVKICRDNGVCSVINDRLDIAIASDADGIHFGQNDLPLECVRQLEQKPMIIGKSTHSLEQLKSACDEYPTYVGLGPVFATTTKPTAEPVGLDYVNKATTFLAEEPVGHVAIGGITMENVEQVLNAGADCIAVCNAVTKAHDPSQACKALKQKIISFDKGLLIKKI
ncbi:MAG: thiamine phosphate synthase [Sedimentisphaerales bacterium]|nr:thiamine phosphate synthase [Sedimentisphaerales bacterium]